jgi:hypothetical protein
MIGMEAFERIMDLILWWFLCCWLAALAVAVIQRCRR